MSVRKRYPARQKNTIQAPRRRPAPIEADEQEPASHRAFCLRMASAEDGQAGCAVPRLRGPSRPVLRCRSGQGPKVGHSPPPRATQPRRRRSDCSGALSAQPQSGAARDGRGAAALPARSPRRAVAWAWAAPTLGAAPHRRSQRRAGRGTAALRCASTSMPESECAGKAAPSGAFRARSATPGARRCDAALPLRSPHLAPGRRYHGRPAPAPACPAAPTIGALEPGR